MQSAQQLKSKKRPPIPHTASGQTADRRCGASRPLLARARDAAEISTSTDSSPWRPARQLLFASSSRRHGLGRERLFSSIKTPAVQGKELAAAEARMRPIYRAAGIQMVWTGTPWAPGGVAVRREVRTRARPRHGTRGRPSALGTHSHTPTGLMTADWHPLEAHLQTLTPEQAKVIRLRAMANRGAL